MLKLAPKLSLPDELATQAIVLVGLRGSGKTNTAGVIVEELLAQHQPVAIIDPTDVWWGLRSSADGSKPGFPVLVIGGEHGQLPLAETDGKTIAQFLVEERPPVVLSVRHLRKGAQRRFVCDLAEELYHLKGRQQYRQPLTVVIDEAPLFIPQDVRGDVAAVVGAIEDLVARGRAAGFGVVIISQRFATINKNVSTQADTIIAHRLPSPQDRKALKEWIEENATLADQKAVLESLAQLADGEAWVWSPRLAIFELVQIRLKSTFDSSKTPGRGEVIRAPRRLAEVDLDSLKSKLAASIEKAQADNPAELRRQLAELKKQLASRSAASPDPAAVDRAEQVGYKRGQKESAAKVRALEAAIDTAHKAMQRVIGAAAAWRMNNSQGPAAESGGQDQPPRAAPKPASRPTVPPPQSATSDPGAGELDAPQQRILDIVGILDARGIEANRESVARWQDLHPNGGRYGANLAFLRAEGYLQGFTPTERGRQAARQQETGVDAALAALPTEPMRAIVRQLLNENRGISREELADLLGLHPNGGRYGANLSRLRTMGLITPRGPIAPTEGLFA